MASNLTTVQCFALVIVIICVTLCVHGDADIGTTTTVSSASSSSSENNGTNVDWIRSVLHTYDTDKGSKNGTFDMNTSASGHHYRVTHVNPSPTSYEDEEDSKDHRGPSGDRSSSGYRGSYRPHPQSQHRNGAQPMNSYDSSEDLGDEAQDSRDYYSSSPPPKSRNYASPRDDESSAQLSSREDSSRKSDPDFGQHYDSDGHRYDFGYDVKDKDGALAFRKESGNAKSLKGSYGIRDVDGRLRIVRYVADEKGFRAKVETNEPGTGSEDAANVYFNGYDAEKIPSHEVVHKDRGQHSFKHGHFNKHVPADSSLYDDRREYLNEQSQDEVADYRLQDPIPMDISPAVSPRMRFNSPMDSSNMVDHVPEHEASIASTGFAAPYKEMSPLYHTSLHHHIHHHPSAHMDNGHHLKYPRTSYAKRRQDSKVTDFTYNLPYTNSLTGFFKTRYL